ncbi:hypothetical protein Taro_006736 [Colocasia esculenta]|uniref:Uncharacterized protein n=1 Tax=Colocasia esculenta TaxID=4460 RepID=A0A843TW62_COLES|nr:hypothetical protein [Colocasia esculenta]
MHLILTSGSASVASVLCPGGVPSVCAEFPPSVFASRVVVTTSSRTEFPTVRLLSSGRVRAGRRRRGGSRGPRNYSPSGSLDPWVATAKSRSSAWAEGRVT